ncbi:MAG: CapA family protein [Acidobacteria bacterium]|nr:CapA family protein [Acidobacteriota bacterium]
MKPEEAPANPGPVSGRRSWLLILGLGLGLFLPRGLPRPEPPPPPPPPPSRAFTLAAVGDIMMHQDVKRAAETLGFDGLWSDVAPLLKGADLAFGNLETPVAPTSGRPGVPFVFNAPEGLPAALRTAGWNVVSTANNHAFDQGSKGVRETLQRLEGAGMLQVGSGPTQADAERPLWLERNGLKIALLACTDIFNVDLNGDAGAPWVHPLDLERVLPAIRAARAEADVVIVSVHWGNEYQHQPSPRQLAAARALVGAGVDLIIGHHPHVLQPLAWVEAEGRKGLVAYSLGNFISNQDRTWRPGQPVPEGDNRDGAMLQVRFLKPQGAPLSIEGGVEPLWTENSWGRPGPRVIRVRRVRPPLDAEPEVRAAMEVRYPRIRSIVGPLWLPEEPSAGLVR